MMQKNGKKTDAEKIKPEPETKFKAGGVVATVWINETDNGKYFSVSVERSYKNSEGEWMRTNSYKANDLAKLRTVVQKAEEYCLMNKPEGTEKERTEEED